MEVTYTLRFRPVGTEVWTEVSGLSGTSHALTGLSAGVRYDVEVVAVAGGLSSSAVVAQRSTRCTAPAQPTVLPTGYALSESDPGTNGGLAASWDAVTGAVSYVVRRRPTEVGSYVAVGGEVEAAGLAMTGLDGTAAYDVEVAAVNLDGDVSAASTARTAVPARIATGGTVTTVGTGGGVTEVVHTFTATGSSTFGLNRSIDVDYLVVAGGGGGGGRHGGGGGGGGMLTGTTAISEGTTVVTVGGGGNGSPFLQSNTSINDTAARTQKGGNSEALGLTAVGGGAGRGKADPDFVSDLSGGSGGGGDASSVAGGSGTAGPPLQGYDGGRGFDNSGVGWSGGGGGGAGDAGGAARAASGDANVGIAGDGGAGRSSSITGTAVLYGGGGGGANYTGGAAGAATGGGGAGGSGAAGTNGTNGRGGGGGGGGHSEGTWAFAGGSGGSGIVVVRYALPA